MKPPKFTDRHRYPHGYKPANQTDIRETFLRVQEEQRQNAAERLRKCVEMKKARKS